MRKSQDQRGPNQAGDARARGKEPCPEACATCGALASALPEGKAFKQCSGCKDVGLMVAYCDRACQAKDWKKGMPPHKQICGKVTGMQDVAPPTQVPSATTSDSLSRFPPPDPGYVRSPALLRQLCRLQENPDIHYSVYSDSNERRDLVFKFPGEIRLLRNNLNRAAQNGNPKSVGLMCQLLQEGCKDLEVSKQAILAQLSEEYGVKVGTIDKLSKPEPNPFASRFWPADPGYSRPPAQLRQLHMLSEHPEWDYFIAQSLPTGGMYLGVAMADPDASQYFHQFILTAAITCGDPKAVGLMFRHLQNGAKMFGVPRETLLHQLSEEYEVDVDTIVEFSTDEAVERMERRMADLLAQADASSA